MMWLLTSNLNNKCSCGNLKDKTSDRLLYYNWITNM